MHPLLNRLTRTAVTNIMLHNSVARFFLVQKNDTEKSNKIATKIPNGYRI
jgi:hypothetical protein